jgi:hypothetical protein
MVGVCDTYGAHEGCIQSFGKETSWKETNGKHRPIWENNIKVGCRSVLWVVLAEHRDRWRTLVHAVMNRRVS